MLIFLIRLPGCIGSVSYTHLNIDTKDLPQLSDIKKLKDAIISFDDLERCELEINQTLGIINNLVEHNEIKVILVANQNEIGKINFSRGLSHKYQVAIDDRVKLDERGTQEDSKVRYTKEQLIKRTEQLLDVYKRQGFTSLVDIDEDEKEFIIAAAEQLECELSDSFFELGNLNKDILTSNPLSGPKLNGTSEEKQKYWKIKRLHETISKALEWAPVEKAFSGMNCIKLAIQNLSLIHILQNL